MSDSENQSLDWHPGPEPSAAHVVFSDFFFEEAAIADSDHEELPRTVSNARFTDVTIILEDEPSRPSFKLHKVLLAAHSSLFRKMFYRDPKEVYEVGAVSKKSFEDIISYIYGGTLTVEMDEFDDILDDVIYLQLDKLEELLKAWEGYIKASRYVRFKASYYSVAGVSTRYRYIFEKM